MRNMTFLSRKDDRRALDNSLKGLKAGVLHNPVASDFPEDMKDILVQAQWVGELLTGLGIETKNILLDPANSDLISELAETQLVFNLVDSNRFEPAAAYWAAALLERLQLPYTGSPIEPMVLTTDKIQTKLTLRHAGLVTPDWIRKGDTGQFRQLTTYLLKPVCEDASIGVSQSSVIQPDSLADLLTALARYENLLGCPCFAEEYIAGRDLDVPLLAAESEGQALTPIELVFNGFSEAGLHEIYTYEAKWGGNPVEYDGVEIRLSQDAGLNTQLQAIARQIWDLFALKGYAKVDFRIDAKGNPHILEINCNPSLYAFWPHHQAGLLDMGSVLYRIVQAALVR